MKVQMLFILAYISLLLLNCSLCNASLVTNLHTFVQVVGTLMIHGAVVSSLVIYKHVVFIIQTPHSVCQGDVRRLGLE